MSDPTEAKEEDWGVDTLLCWNADIRVVVSLLPWLLGVMRQFQSSKKKLESRLDLISVVSPCTPILGTKYFEF